MANLVLGLLAETSLHPGSGQTAGAIDLPVQREAATDYPVIFGSSFKGALRDWARGSSTNKDMIDRLFGKQDQAGDIGISDARLLLLPVRSLQHAYAWVTCPNILERFQRDMRLIDQSVDFVIPHPEESQAVVGAASSDTMFLEEFSFDTVEFPGFSQIVKAISPLILHSSVQQRLHAQLVVLHDNDFKHFAQFGLPVAARNQLDTETKNSKNLWYEETIPANALLYSLIMARPGATERLADFRELFSQSSYAQVGGNSTVGQGWCAVTINGEG